GVGGRPGEQEARLERLQAGDSAEDEAPLSLVSPALTAARKKEIAEQLIERTEEIAELMQARF
ncbi:MAG TPA: hypothetical protein VF278_23635, partial [Pirellulales bacterium]